MIFSSMLFNKNVHLSALVAHLQKIQSIICLNVALQVQQELAKPGQLERFLGNNTKVDKDNLKSSGIPSDWATLVWQYPSLGNIGIKGP